MDVGDSEMRISGMGILSVKFNSVPMDIRDVGLCNFPSPRVLRQPRSSGGAELGKIGNYRPKREPVTASRNSLCAWYVEHVGM
jgi:hypothetical protein